MISMDQARTLKGKTLLGAGGSKLGTIDSLYADREDGDLTFATVNTGKFGSKTSFVPLGEASLKGDDVVVAYDEDLVSSAPQIDEDSDLSPEEEQRLYAHYGLSGNENYNAQFTADTSADTSDRENVHGTVGHDTSGPTTDDAMTRSEEQLRVGKQQVETGRVRLRKFVVEENVTETVPVTREEVRIEREPITDANVGNAMDGPAISEEEHEVVLHAERAVVQKEAVPVERVRVDVDTVTEQQQVNETVRKEQIEMEGGEATTRQSGDVYPEGERTETKSELDIEPRR
jgi:uncharacterized protein (TIGR02271 family)